MMLKAKDIMTKPVTSVSKDTPILEAMELMAQKNITALPVVENDNSLIGILSEKDVLGLLHVVDRAEKQKVSNFMTQPAVHFNVEESLLDVCDCLTNNSFRRVPVTKNGKVVGIISRKDILKYIIELQKKETQTPRPSRV